MSVESKLELITKVLSDNKQDRVKYLEKLQLLLIRLDQLSNDTDDLEMAIRNGGDMSCCLLPHELKELNDHKELQSSISAAMPLLLLSMLANKNYLDAH